MHTFITFYVAGGYKYAYKFSLGNIWKIGIVNRLRLIFQRNVIRQLSLQQNAHFYY
jgi:hypothetical protein